MNKKFILVLVLLIVGVLSTKLLANDYSEPFQNNPLNINETQSPEFLYEHMYERYQPNTMNPLIARLPEYSSTGPGYICERRQPPMVYRFRIQYNRHIGYREADWIKNDMIDKHMYPVNFGGYTF